MARRMNMPGFLPTIKCSSCNAEIEISAMGDHICSKYAQSTPPPDPYYQNNFDRPTNPGYGRDPTYPKPGRLPPPRINPSAANRPFLRPDQPTPASSGNGSHVVSPLTPSSGRSNPYRMPARSHTSPLSRGPPSPEFTNFDCAFPPFPTSGSRSGTPVSHAKSISDFDNDYVRMHAEPIYGPVSPRNNRSGSIAQRMDTKAPDPFDTRTRGDAWDSRRTQLTGHRRSASMGYKAYAGGAALRHNNEPIQRPSPAGGGRARKASLASLSGGLRGGLIGAPPLPSGPTTNSPPRPEGNYGQFAATPEPRKMETLNQSERPQNLQASPPRPARPEGSYGGLGQVPGPVPMGPMNPYNQAPSFPNNLPPRGRQGGRFGGDEAGGMRPPDPMRQPDRFQRNPSNPPHPMKMDDDYDRSGPYPGPQPFDPMVQPNRSQPIPNKRSETPRFDGDYDGFGPPGGQRNPEPNNPPMSQPNRSQTFPIRNESRVSGNGPNGSLPRRPSEPSPASRNRRPTVSDQSGPPFPGQQIDNPFVAYRPPGQGPTPQQRGDNQYPPRGPSRNGVRKEYGEPDSSPPRGPSRTGGRDDFGERNPCDQLPPRSTSRNEWRNPYDMAKAPPLPVSNLAAELDIGNPYHTPNESTSSNETSSSVAQSGSSVSSPPRSDFSGNSRRKRSNTNAVDTGVRPAVGGLQSKYTAFSNQRTVVLDPPRRPDMYDQGLDSPTDPAFQQGRLSPIPRSNNRIPREPPPQPKPKAAPPTKQATAGNKGNCRGCGLMIQGKSVSSADGRLTGRYHKDCFVCKTCEEPFQTADFYVLNNHPYCSQHYHASNGSLCRACDRGIEGQYLETEATQKYHPDCLTCHTCRLELRDDYFELNGKVYCERDAKRAAQQPSNFLGVGGPGGRSWHPERRTTRLMMM